GIRVNKIPVVVGSLAVEGGYVEPASFFRDHPAPVGTLSYQVVMTDMFGRQSPPASISFEMEEWHVPPPPHGIYAEYANGATTITWTPSEPDPASVPKTAAGKPIRYHIYRVDIEKRPVTVDLISTETFNGLFAPGVAQSMKAVMALVPQARPLFSSARFGTPAPTHAVMFGQSRKADPAISTRMSADQFMAKAAAAPGQAEATRQVTSILQAGFLSFADNNPPKDHYYRYLVTAQYETSARESVPLFSSRIPVPLDTPPAAPASLKYTFGPPQKESGTVSEAVILKGAGGRGKSIATEASRQGVAKWTTSSDFRKKSAHTILYPNRAPDIGGTLILTWDPVQGTKPMTYRVYRANASDYFLPAPSPSTGAAGGSTGRMVARRMLERTGRMLAGGESRTSAHGVINLKQLASSAGMATISQTAYSLLGQTEDDGTAAGSLSFEEDLPQTQAHYYQYRVVPVNRWGVAGNPKDLLVRV
ncbi:MAG: hypothetical protein LC772_12750, partial [Chloroflexi bacterium]|nr:hypothetical protein [Chloroflexota bacterium]